jgi:hypothetical protein
MGTGLPKEKPPVTSAIPRPQRRSGADRQNRVNIWNTATGAILQTFKDTEGSESGNVVSASFGAEGRYVVTTHNCGDAASKAPLGPRRPPAPGPPGGQPEPQHEQARAQAEQSDEAVEHGVGVEDPSSRSCGRVDPAQDEGLRSPYSRGSATGCSRLISGLSMV